jgi:hypothetical protein
MKKWLVFLLAAALLIGIGFAPGAMASTLGQDPIPPPGFAALRSAPGVRMYRKDYPGGQPDFVQVVSLQEGASVRLMAGPSGALKPGQGAFGGNDGVFFRQGLLKFWRDLARAVPNAFCVVNGQFFYLPENPSRLVFPIKIDGKILTDGSGVRNDHPGQQLMLELWSDHADIRELNAANLASSTAPEIIGGLTAEANKQAKRVTGRTFLGVIDRDGDGVNETVLVFNTTTANQPAADAVLKTFGASKVMMLDGGGSTQVICQDQWVIFSERLIPQAIGIVAAASKPAPGGAPQPAGPTATAQVGPGRVQVEAGAASGQPAAGQAAPGPALPGGSIPISSDPPQALPRPVVPAGKQPTAAVSAGVQTPPQSPALLPPPTPVPTQALVSTPTGLLPTAAPVAAPEGAAQPPAVTGLMAGGMSVHLPIVAAQSQPAAPASAVGNVSPVAQPASLSESESQPAVDPAQAGAAQAVGAAANDYMAAAPDPDQEVDLSGVIWVPLFMVPVAGIVVTFLIGQARRVNGS